MRVCDVCGCDILTYLGEMGMMTYLRCRDCHAEVGFLTEDLRQDEEEVVTEF